MIILLLAASLPAHAEETAFLRVEKSKTINCGYITWPPYIIKDPNTGKVSGINYDIMEAIGRNLGLKINWIVETGSGEIAAALNAQKFDVMCASLWPAAGRLQTLTMTRATFYNPVHAFTRADDQRFDSNIEKANIKDVKISAIDGDYSYDLAKEKLPNATIVSLPMTASGSEFLMQIMTKKADIVMCDVGLVNDFMKTNPNTLRKVASIPPVRIYGELLSVRRGEYQLRDMIDHAITQLADDGVIETILQKYEKNYGVKYYSPTPSYVVPR